MRLGTYCHTGKFVDTGGDSVRGEFGFIGGVDHAVNERLSVFARIGAALGDRSTVPWSVETGFNLSPVFASGDRLGIGIAYVDLNRSPVVTGTATALRHEIIVEGTLNIPITQRLGLQPDAQYIIDPGGASGARNATGADTGGNAPRADAAAQPASSADGERQAGDRRRLPPEVLEKLRNMPPEERRAYIAKLREERAKRQGGAAGAPAN